MCATSQAAIAGQGGMMALDIAKQFANPAPATKNTRLIKDFKAEHNARLLSFQILVNTWSTFYEPPIDGQHDRAERGNHAAALHAGSSQAQISAVTSASGRPSRAVPPE